MLIEGSFPFVGEVSWLTPGDGGRRLGVPQVLPGVSYAHVAYVPPRTIEDGMASFVLRGWNPARWQSPAEGRWLVVENEGAQLVTAGTVVVVCEGARPVATFRIDEIRA